MYSSDYLGQWKQLRNVVCSKCTRQSVDSLCRDGPDGTDTPIVRVMRCVILSMELTELHMSKTCSEYMHTQGTGMTS